MASIKGCYQPKTKSFDDLTNKPPKERKKGKKEKKRKEKKRKPKRKGKRKREKRKGEWPAAKGEGERECTASRERRGEAPRVTTNRRKPPSPPPTSVKPGKPPKPVFRKVFIFNLQKSFENCF